jgi:hypothetical protein
MIDNFYCFDKNIKKIKLREKINSKVLYSRQLKLLKSLFFKYDPITHSFYIPLSQLNGQENSPLDASRKWSWTFYYYALRRVKNSH